MTLEHHVTSKPRSRHQVYYWERGGGEKKRAYQRMLRAKDPQKFRDRHKKWNWDSKIKALNAYGGKCICCGITEPKFLALDHINGSGNQHRKTIGNKTIYVWLRQNNYPKGFQVLCHNCNMATAFWPQCPHKITTPQ